MFKLKSLRSDYAAFHKQYHRCFDNFHSLVNGKLADLESNSIATIGLLKAFDSGGHKTPKIVFGTRKFIFSYQMFPGQSFMSL